MTETRFLDRLFFLLFFLLGAVSGVAQQYPVRLVPVLVPPYSMRLGDYATGTDSKLQLQVLMTDLLEPQHRTGIKFSLEAGLNAVPYAQSGAFVAGLQPFTLYPGSNVTLTNVDLRALFELQNLNGINASQYSQPLPDGVYQFCFQAYDYYTKNNLSQKACATAFLTQYDPPMLSLPQDAEKVQALAPYSGGSGILFQWMPRQVAPNTRYIFTLKELWDTGQSPVSGFLSSPPLWREEAYAPNLYYGVDKTQLIPGKRYAWQVQARSGNPVVGANPAEDNGVYKNNGLSEIFYFDYVENCAVPTLLMAKNAGRGRVELSWSLAGQPSGLYSVQWRKRGSSSEWQAVQSYQPRYTVTGLEDQAEYEYRIGSVCGNLQTFNNTDPNTDGGSAGNAYAFSGIQYFTTDGKDKASQNYQCGVMPAVDISNKNPLQASLGTDEVFTAGDFPVTVISAQGGNGVYSGTGYIVVPYLADTKIKVSFSNIKLNTDRKLVEGAIETSYDPTEKNVIAVGDILNDLGNLFDGIVKIIDNAIGSGGMSPKDFDDLSNNLGTYTGQNETTVSNLYDQGLISKELKDKIQAEKEKIENLLKNLNCTKDEKGKGSNNDFKFEDECTEKLKELKTDLQDYQNLVSKALSYTCIWNIAPNENLKGKTFYFQTSEKNNDGEGKKMYKLKAEDCPLSFNKNGYVYTFRSNGKIYRPFSDNAYYFSKTSDDQYAFENGDSASLIDVKVDKNNSNGISINNQQVTAQQDCTDDKERGQGLSEDLVFSSVVKDKYSVVVEKNGKGELVSTFKLLGKGKSSIPTSQKDAIQNQVQELMNDALIHLKDPKDINSLSNKAEVTDSGFYVKQMTGKEWLATLSDLGANVWEEAALPKDYWKEDEAGHQNSPIKMPALFTGVADGGIGLVTDYPQLIKLGYDVATKEEVRTGIWSSIKEISPSSVKTMATDAIKQKIDNYNFTDKPYLGYHELGKDGVTVVSAIMGSGFLKAGDKALENATKTTGDKIKEAIKNKLDDIEKEFLSDTFKDLLINKFKSYKGLLSFDEWSQRYKTLYKNRKIGKLTEDEFQLLEGGLKPKKGITTSDGKRYFDNVLEGTAREVKSGPVTLSKYKDQILKDIEILKRNLTNGQISKIEWHCFDDVDEIQINKFIKDELKDKSDYFKIIKH